LRRAGNPAADAGVPVVAKAINDEEVASPQLPERMMEESRVRSWDRNRDCCADERPGTPGDSLDRPVHEAPMPEVADRGDLDPLKLLDKSWRQRGGHVAEAVFAHGPTGIRS
jgi:hypothetical protein